MLSLMCQTNMWQLSKFFFIRETCPILPTFWQDSKLYIQYSAQTIIHPSGLDRTYTPIRDTFTYTAQQNWRKAVDTIVHMCV